MSGTADDSVRVLGKIEASRIRETGPARVPHELVAAFRDLGELSSAVSDALDELGLSGAISSAVLCARLPQACLVGVALTLRNEPQRASVGEAVGAKRNGMADIECHNLAQPGDVLVVQGIHDGSNLGGVSSRLGKRQGELGAIVDGAIRDVSDFKANDFPVWSTAVTPKTGKWRLQAAEINGTVTICGVTVEAGDLVVADSTGVCFVPRLRAAEVLALVRRKVQSERDTCAAIDAGASFAELAAAAPRPGGAEAPPVAPPADRLPPIPAIDWSESQRHHAQAIVEGPRGALISPFVPLLRSPELMNLAQRMGEYLRYRSGLPPGLFELAVLVVARHWSQDVEWAIHVPIALGAGLEPDTVEALRRGGRPATLDSAEAAVYSLCTEMLVTQRVGDTTWQACCSSFGERGTIDLIGVCGYYSLLAMVMNAARTPVPNGVLESPMATLPPSQPPYRRHS